MANAPSSDRRDKSAPPSAKTKAEERRAPLTPEERRKRVREAAEAFIDANPELLARLAK